MTVATEPVSNPAVDIGANASADTDMIARLDRMERVLRRVEALLDAVDRHPIARRWLGLP